MIKPDPKLMCEVIARTATLNGLVVWNVAMKTTAKK
jgi:hypothetical protein